MRISAFFPKQMVQARIVSALNVRFFYFMRRSAEPLASIWLQPCSVLIDPKENCGFKVQVCWLFSVAMRSLMRSIQVQAMKGSRKKVFDDSELVLQCESEAERDDWIRLLKTFATGP